MMNKSWKNQLSGMGIKLLVICFWLLVWELLSLKINEVIFLPAPLAVLSTLIVFLGSMDFWLTILNSSLHIMLGFALALVIGTVLSAAAYNIRIVRELISPVMKVMKAVPVASFILLVLLWIDSKNLSIVISFLMVLPLIYTNVLQGLRETDIKLLQMARVFRISRVKKIRSIYVPAVRPYFISAISFGIGFCWKSGIAAEVIGISAGSIGEQLYETKIYLMTTELFAWTVVIVIISMLFETVVMHLLRLVPKEQGESGKSTK